MGLKQAQFKRIASIYPVISRSLFNGRMMRTEHLILILIREGVACVLQSETRTLGFLLGWPTIVVVIVVDSV